MGSEGPSVVTVHVTGFKKFHGVSENPTEIIVRNLKGFMQKKGLPEGLVLGNCNVLETAGEGAVPRLYEVLRLAVDGQQNKETSDRGQIIWVNHSVYSAIFKWQSVHHTYTLRLFYNPLPSAIIRTSMSFFPYGLLQTSLPVSEIVKGLSKMGYDVMPSDDAGRFVCNFVYYHSLRFAERNRIKSLFVHVPLFLTIDEETQMEFVASLLKVLASLH
ncbi:hypothetical protein B296_00040089 [Ensete ventricosum]|uniref:Pyrrolidone-carboxylate peptidase n=1 Tax=Ensete ventricosum TaxID=4639 RepID=A0A426ZIL2_ENSVE|nr:hypothetical protein B296_00040089 [Ensete ventricosum]